MNRKKKQQQGTTKSKYDKLIEKAKKARGFNDAEKLLLKALSIKGDKYQAPLQLGILFYKQRRIQQAIKYLKQSIVSQYIDNYHEGLACYLLRHCYHQLSKYKQATRYCRKEIKADPIYSGEALFFLAYSQLTSKDFKRGIQTISHPTLVNTVVVPLLYAYMHMIKNEPDNAIKYFHDVLDCKKSIKVRKEMSHDAESFMRYAKFMASADLSHLLFVTGKLDQAWVISKCAFENYSSSFNSSLEHRVDLTQKQPRIIASGIPSETLFRCMITLHNIQFYILLSHDQFDEAEKKIEILISLSNQEKHNGHYLFAMKNIMEARNTKETIFYKRALSNFKEACDKITQKNLLSSVYRNIILCCRKLDLQQDVILYSNLLKSMPAKPNQMRIEDIESDKNIRITSNAPQIVSTKNRSFGTTIGRQDRFYTNIGDIAKNTGGHELADEHYKQSLLFNPNGGITYISRGDNAYKALKFTLAIQWYHRALGSLPRAFPEEERLRVYCNLGHSYFRVGYNGSDSNALKQAIHWYDKVLTYPQSKQIKEQTFKAAEKYKGKSIEKLRSIALLNDETKCNI